MSLDAGLGGGAPNCVDDGAATMCAIALNPGSYIGTIVTYDGPLSATQQPTGTVLSKDQSFPIAIVAGQTNTPVISLYGAPSGIQFSSFSNNLGIPRRTA
jgi:hypothetical protein